MFDGELFDQDGYPTEDVLEWIRRWGYDMPETSVLIELLSDLWSYEDYFVLRDEGDITTLELHTGGWSGNESIVASLRQTLFWIAFWEKSERGGHYYFEIPNKVIKFSSNHD